MTVREFLDMTKDGAIVCVYDAQNDWLREVQGIEKEIDERRYDDMQYYFKQYADCEIESIDNDCVFYCGTNFAAIVLEIKQ